MLIRNLSPAVILDPAFFLRAWIRGSDGWQSARQNLASYSPLGALFFPAKKSDPLDMHLIKQG
jgi:hypothetical protein